MSFQDKQSSDVTIQIKDANNVILHQEKVTDQKSFEKKFNLKNLPVGGYFLEVSDEFKKVVQPIGVKFSNIEIDQLARSEFYKPAYQFKDNKLDIKLIATNCNEVNIDFYNEQNELIFRKKFENVGKPFAKRLDLNQLAKGKYQVNIKVGTQFYYKTVEVK